MQIKRGVRRKASPQKLARRQPNKQALPLFFGPSRPGDLGRFRGRRARSDRFRTFRLPRSAFRPGYLLRGPLKTGADSDYPFGAMDVTPEAPDGARASGGARIDFGNSKRSVAPGWTPPDETVHFSAAREGFRGLRYAARMGRAVCLRRGHRAGYELYRARRLRLTG